MSTCLFMGGVADGERKPINDLLMEICIPKPKPALILDDHPFAISIEHETYRRSELRCGEKRWFVYVLKHWPEHGVIENLLAGYKKPL